MIEYKIFTFYHLIMERSPFQFHHKGRMIRDQIGICNFLPDYDNVSRMPFLQCDLFDNKNIHLGAKPIRNKKFGFPYLSVIMKLFISTLVEATK